MAVWNCEVVGIIGKWGVCGGNGNDEHLTDTCVERGGLFLVKTLNIEHRSIHMHT